MSEPLEAEVNEEIRSQQLKSIWNKFGLYIIGIAILIIFSVGGYEINNYWDSKTSQKESDLFDSAILMIEEGDQDQGYNKLIELSNGKTGYKGLALFRLSSESYNASNYVQAIDFLKRASEDSSLTIKLREFARLKAGLILVDHGSLDDVKNLLNPLTKKNGPFSFHAKEIIALSLLGNDMVSEAKLIFEDIAKTALENNSRLIIMGTHGAKGMQKVFGSFALKVITSCTVPFMIVQENVKPGNISKIVTPINLSKESLQIIGAVSNLAMAFNAEIHVLGTKFTDGIQKSKMKNRIQVVRNEFTMKKVRSTFKLMDSSKSFTNHVLDYSNEIDADMIAIAHYSEKIIAQLDNFTQNIITNKKQTPVLIIKGIEASVGSF